MTLTQEVTGRQQGGVAPWLQQLCKSLEIVDSTYGDTPARTYNGSPEKLKKIQQCWHVWEESEMGLQGKIGTEI